jgi:hypothetical protein
MKTTPETEAKIVRLHYAEHWPVGTIATQIQAHPDVVRRVLGLGEPRARARTETDPAANHPVLPPARPRSQTALCDRPSWSISRSSA